MSLLPLALVVIVTFGGAVALLVALIAGPAVRALDTVEPAQRARWLVGLLAAPWGVGLATIVAAWTPCLFEGRGTTPREAVEVCRFCLFHPTPMTGLVWVLGLLAAAPFVRAAIIGLAGICATRRVIDGVRPVARRDALSGHLWIPGSHSFVAGWPRAEVYVGEGLASALAPSALEAVVAHEQAHVARGDVALRWSARLLSAGHVPSVARTLLGALDLAVEQACDAAASQRVRDPLLVAEALIAVSRMDPTGPRVVPAFASVGVEPRVRALCDARWVPATRSGVLAAAVCASVAGMAVAYAAPLHHAAEAFVTLISR